MSNTLNLMGDQSKIHPVKMYRLQATSAKIYLLMSQLQMICALQNNLEVQQYPGKMREYANLVGAKY